MTLKNGVTSIIAIQLLIVFKAKTIYKRHSNNHHNNFIHNFSYIPQLYNNKDLSKTTRCTITKSYRVLVHPIVKSGDRQCKLRMRQHLAKLPLAYVPLMVERESKKRSISMRCFTFPAAPLTVEREREQGEHLHLSWSRACAFLYRMTNCQHVSLAVGKNEGNHFMSTFLV